jgi:thymidylate kinase
MAGYRDLAARNRRRFLVINADCDLDAVEADIWQQLRKRMSISNSRYGAKT